MLAQSLAVAALLLVAGCLGPAPALDPASVAETAASLLPVETGECVAGAGGPAPPPGEEAVGLQPIDLIFGGSVRHPLTRVLLVPPTHGDLGSPDNLSRSGPEYLAATLEGIFAWEPAIDAFIEENPEFAYLDAVKVEVDVYEPGLPTAAGYDIVVGYVETSGPVFRGVAIAPPGDPQETFDQAGLGDVLHYGNRYVLLSLFAYSERAGQTAPDFPETHEIRGVTMHEFAHVWGLGHSTTFTTGCGGDLMNSPYPYVYGDGNAVGDGGERTRPLCISNLDLYGIAHLYRWLPNGAWEGSEGNLTLPSNDVYKEYCMQGEARARADAFLRARRPG